ncbi:MAG TPA: hypothetical protein VFH43_10995, partial [Candidatus Kapabacteria bacterium]|nr:hypothetical protein [Candidatus Kapabacteria bacterium]
LTLTGPLTLDGDVTLAFGGSTGNNGDVLVSDGNGNASWQTLGGGGGGVPTSRTLITTSPLTIGGGASADLSADRTLAFDFSVANNWTGEQTFLQTTAQGNLLVASINAGDQAIGVAHGGTGKTSLTANRVLLGNGTSAITEVPQGNENEVLTLVSGVPTWKASSSEVTLSLASNVTTSSSTLDSVPGLTLTIAANEVWEFEYCLKLGSTGNGMNFAFNTPSGNCAALLTATSGASTAVATSTVRMTDNATSATVCVTTVADQKHFAIIKGFVTAGATGGVFPLRWRVPSGTGTMYAGSRFTARRAL